MEVIATDEYHAKDSVIYQLNVNSYCGDGIKQTPNTEGQGGPMNAGVEECDGEDGVATNPTDSMGGFKEYACTDDCVEGTDCTGTCSSVGGYCGDGIVQSDYGEMCDPEETQEHYENRMGVTLKDYEFMIIDLSCLDNCLTGCLGDPELGKGCYLAEDNGCRKGRKICDADGRLECFDVFTANGGEPVRDECCMNNKEALEDGEINGKDFEFLRASEDFIVSGDTFMCDDICSKTGLVCVGVGLKQVAINSCIYIKDHRDNNCNLDSNQASNDCRVPYRRTGSTCREEPTEVLFSVHETGCYCYAP